MCLHVCVHVCALSMFMCAGCYQNRLHTVCTIHKACVYKAVYLFMTRRLGDLVTCPIE